MDDLTKGDCERIEQRMREELGEGWEVVTLPAEYRVQARRGRWLVWSWAVGTGERYKAAYGDLGERWRGNAVTSPAAAVRSVLLDMITSRAKLELALTDAEATAGHALTGGVNATKGEVT